MDQRAGDDAPCWLMGQQGEWCRQRGEECRVLVSYGAYAAIGPFRAIVRPSWQKVSARETSHPNRTRSQSPSRPSKGQTFDGSTSAKRTKKGRAVVIELASFTHAAGSRMPLSFVIDLSGREMCVGARIEGYH